jgi:hypothetical protein
VSDDTIEKIRAELFRLRARVEDVGRDGIEAGARGDDGAVLQCRSGRDFYWTGRADEILQRLSGLPDDSGPEAIRSEFG